MILTVSRAQQIPCPSQISPPAPQNLPLKAIRRPRRWPHPQRWLPSNRQRQCPHPTLFNAHPLPTLSIPNRRPRIKHLKYNGRCPHRRQLPPNRINDQINTSEQAVNPILRLLQREGFSINSCTNRPAQTDPEAFKGRLFVGSLVQLMPPSLFSAVLCKMVFLLHSPQLLHVVNVLTLYLAP